MKWIVRETSNTKAILDMYSELFNEDFTLSEFNERTKSYDVYMFIIGTQDFPNAGFSILLCEKETVELWQMGILPECRSKGAGKVLLLHCEDTMVNLGFSRIFVESFNRWNNMLLLLIKNGYRIVNTSYSQQREDLRITLIKELTRHKELRYALTEVCNFDCLFCHNEGLGHFDRMRISDSQVLETLTEVVSLGYTDITFTGGEPLLRKDTLQFLLDNLGNISNPPMITLVTNGSLLDTDVIECLNRYPSDKKIHLSLHAANETTFKELTRTTKSGIFQKVIRNITNAVEAGLTVKVNHVVLKGYNHNTVTDFIELVRETGASAVKFIELLILPEHPDDYNMFFSIDSIRPKIEQVAKFYEQPNIRQQIFHHSKDTQFRIEAQRCTCAIGCSHCREVRDRTISSDLLYYPCFVRSNKGYSLTDSANLQQVFLDGERIIDGFAEKYGDSSPTLIAKDEIMASSKTEFFFIILDFESFIEYLRTHHFNLVSKKSFHEEHYWPVNPHEEWLTFRKKLKFGWYDFKPENVALIYTDNEYIEHPGIGLENRTSFLSSKGPVEFSDANELRRLLNSMEFKKHFEINWSVEVWKYSDTSVNIALMEEKSSIRIEGDPETVRKHLKLFDNYVGILKPLTVPLTQFMKDATEND